MRIQSEFSIWNIFNYNNIIGINNINSDEEALDKHTKNKIEASKEEYLLLEQTNELEKISYDEELTNYYFK